MQPPAIHQESATRIKINSITNVIYPEGRTTSRIEPSHSKAECHEDIGSPRTSGVVVGEYRESEITPSLVSQNKPQDLGMTYSESQLPTSDTLAASDTAASVQIFWETCLKQKPPDESKNALSEPTKMTQ
jgi:hypothetical protein